MKITKEDILKMETRYRAKFVNSLNGSKSINLIGTEDSHGNTNLSIVSSVFHLGSDPALMGMIIRPHTVPRDTLENILEIKKYTINHVHSGILKKAHQTSARYEKKVSEFSEVGLTSEYKGIVQVPYVKESRIQLGMSFIEKIHIAANKTEMIIGSIEEVYFPEDILCDDGYLNIQSAGTIAGSGLDAYFDLEPIARLSYAKTDREVETLDFKTGKPTKEE